MGTLARYCEYSSPNILMRYSSSPLFFHSWQKEDTCDVGVDVDVGDVVGDVKKKMTSRWQNE